MKPGKCIGCGAADKPVVDMGLNIEWVGRIYLCAENCAREFGRTVGMVDASENGEPSQSFEYQLYLRNAVAIPREHFRILVSSFDNLRSALNNSAGLVPLENASLDTEASGRLTDSDIESLRELAESSSEDSETLSSERSSGIPSIE
jgi:hypothetical protein